MPTYYRLIEFAKSHQEQGFTTKLASKALGVSKDSIYLYFAQIRQNKRFWLEKRGGTAPRYFIHELIKDT